jgi:hypothetical protein
MNRIPANLLMERNAFLQFFKPANLMVLGGQSFAQRGQINSLSVDSLHLCKKIGIQSAFPFGCGQRPPYAEQSRSRWRSH